LIRALRIVGLKEGEAAQKLGNIHTIRCAFMTGNVQHQNTISGAGNLNYPVQRKTAGQINKREKAARQIVHYSLRFVVSLLET